MNYHKIENKLQLNTVKQNSIDIDSVSTVSSNSHTCQIQDKSSNIPPKLINEDISNITTTHSSNNNNNQIPTQLDEMFINLMIKVKKENPQITTQKNSISRSYYNLHKTRIQSNIEINIINPSNSLMTKQNNNNKQVIPQNGKKN